MSPQCEPTVTELPVYEVVRTGIPDKDAQTFAGKLGVPEEKLQIQRGVASFLDTDNYLAVPTVTIREPRHCDPLLKATKNQTPEIPLEVKAIDYDALSKCSPIDRTDAYYKTLWALEYADLYPEHATPVTGHTVFKTVSKERLEGVPASTTTKIDTHVSFRFTLDGYLLVGPGAQIQVSYDPDGNVTRLLHSTRTMKKGPSVKVLPVEEVRGRYARFLPDDAEIKVRLVYWAPPLRPGIYSEQSWNPRTILPWYAVTIRRQLINPGTRKAQTQTSRVHLVPATCDSRFVPSVTVRASTPHRSLVEAHASVTGGTPPFNYLWAGSNPEASSSTGNFVRYVPLARDFRPVSRTLSADRTDNVSVTVVDANGITAQSGQSVHVTVQPAPETHSSVTYGCKSPNDPGPSPIDGSYAPERIAWLQAMGAPGQGGGSQRFCWLADSSWPGDYIEPVPPATLEPTPWVNGDADFSNWGINTTNIMLYNGDGNPNAISEMYPGATLADYNADGGAILRAPGDSGDVQIGNQAYNVNYNGSWGAPNSNDQLQWLAMYACQVLENDDSAADPWDRWGAAFNGLHSILGFETEASDAGVGFMTDFPQNILGTNGEPQTLVQGWLNAANSNNMGTPAAMGPILNLRPPVFIYNYADKYWGKGSVGPNISQADINGWWYIQGTDAVQEFP